MRISTVKVRTVATILLQDERDNGKIINYLDVKDAMRKCFELCPHWEEDCDKFELYVELIRRFRAICPEG